MSDGPESLVLRYLRGIDAKVDDLHADMSEVKQSLTTLEVQVANLSSTEVSHYAQVMQRLDCHGTRLDRIEHRLGLIDISVA
jgi:hypothetical protein